MNTKQPLSKALLVVVGLLTASVAGISAYLAYVTSDWWRHEARLLSVLSHPLVATGIALLVVGLALGSYEFVRAVRHCPRLSPFITLVVLCGAVVLAPLFVANGLHAQKHSASTQLIEDLRVPEPQGQSTPNTKD